MREDDDPADIEPIDHDEPDDTRRRAALLARLRQVSKATWLLVHDADEVEDWTQHGFRVVEPPPDVPADEAVLVLARLGYSKVVSSTARGCSSAARCCFACARKQ